MRVRLYILFLILLAGFSLNGKTASRSYAQDTVSTQTEISQNIKAGDHYLAARTAALGKLVHRNAKVQKQLLTKLSHAEHNLTGLQAKVRQPLTYGYARHSLDFDSIQKLAANPLSLNNKGSPKIHKLIDSLKGIQAFIQQQSGKLSHATDLTSTAGIPGDYGAKLQQLQQQLSAQEQLQKLIDQRNQALQQLFPGKNIPALNRITKQIAIAKA